MEIRINRTAVLAVALVAAGFLMRIIPHTANLAPVGAIALFAGAVLGWRYALWIPLAIMVASDSVIGMYSTVLFTWAGFLLVAAYGLLFRNRPYLQRVTVGALGSSFIFYAVSNFGVWLDRHWQLYPLTWQGFVDCYVMALPFLRNTFVADLGFSAVLFGVYALAQPAFHGVWTLRLAFPHISKQTK